MHLDLWRGIAKIDPDGSACAEYAYGMKREYGEEEPKGAKSVTAPATVSGE